MTLLNRYALGTLRSAKYDIYMLKNRMTRYLYLNYPTDVQLKRQVLTCTSCDGTGTHFSYYYGYDECWHCHGTGIYRKADILAFTFHIEDQVVRWHQPRGLVDFDVYIPSTTTVYEGEKEHLYSVDDDFLLAFYVVVEFMWQNGLWQSRGGLWDAIKVDLRGIRLTLPHWCRYHWDRLVDELIADKPYYDAVDGYDEIPF